VALNPLAGAATIFSSRSRDPRRAVDVPDRPRLLQRLALHRPELRAWAMYDWANSAMVTVVITAVYPIFFSKVAMAGAEPGEAVKLHAQATTASLLLVAVLAPLLGVISDRTAKKKALLLAFLLVGVISCAGLFFVGPGDRWLSMALFMAANVGAMGSFVFYDALLPHVAREGEVDRLSTSGYALGYLGGGILLALDLLIISRPEWFGLPSGENLTPSEASLPARIAFLSVAIWWLLFSIPLLRRVPEPPGSDAPTIRGTRELVRAAFGGLGETFRDLRRFPQATLMLVAFLIYNDGIMTVIRMSTIYGEELGLEPGQMMLALLLVQFVGIPCTVLFGFLGARIGAKRAVLIGLAVYGVIALLARGLTTTPEFFAMAILVGLVQGGTQGLSRSLFASLIPRKKSGEFFGLFAVFDRFAGILGPLLFYAAIASTGNVRSAVLPIMLFFVIGAVILTRVDVEKGRRAAANDG